ncbi:regulator of chromosome condensation 1/beta-lactamase-inhibitor protein II [Microdochium trichocladiopsis]|uniref:Regulator of chromosome condensation 1/beta-lactamase-inhibitor protein II n=1 Tax=Microdochium trichocladiopsis TaxID=1682393 RepID=A0A9P9BI78_9PEZI|nr:regulator of chromosome condensation 1/beta-lactamase-inhibitor protein II [Microdochium trichocladiopsis]KAH7014133.1 regulator of chromosome condensation 1/beta-lactamase-inhibitor protein II [Microdochium trichocladiopsis]
MPPRKAARGASSGNEELTSRHAPQNGPAKRSRTANTQKETTNATTATARTRRAPPPPPAVINQAPSTKLDVFVFGEGSFGELGLGNSRYGPDNKLKPVNVKRPRINHLLQGRGVVLLACGGMHVIALTHDNRILTWGVNDHGALGRDTFWSGGTRDIDAEDDNQNDDDESFKNINPLESTPGEISYGAIPDGTTFTQVAASSSASFVVTATGDVYGWGTFRGDDGVIGFLSPGNNQQNTPVKIPVKGIMNLSCGSNHVLALDKDGKVWTWGAPGQGQLGRRITTRGKDKGARTGLKPEVCFRFSRPECAAINIATGSYHSFYIDASGQVYGWGLNNYCQAGQREVGEGFTTITTPKLVERLAHHSMAWLAGGEHHTVVCTQDGVLLSWGRCDGGQTGRSDLGMSMSYIIHDEHGRPKATYQPQVLDIPHCEFVAAGTDTSFAIDAWRHVYSWGFSANYQTGLGTDEDVREPERIANSAIRDREIIWVGAGGQYGIVAAAVQEK